MKKIFISINGVRHGVVDLKICESGYHGHNLVKNQKHLDSIDRIFVEESVDLKSMIKQIEKANDEGMKKISKKIDSLSLEYNFSKQELMFILISIVKKDSVGMSLGLKTLKQKLKRGEIS